MFSNKDIKSVLILLEKQVIKESIVLPQTRQAIQSLNQILSTFLANDAAFDIKKLKEAMKVVNEALSHESEVHKAKDNFHKTVQDVQKRMAPNAKEKNKDLDSNLDKNKPKPFKQSPKDFK